MKLFLLFLFVVVVVIVIVLVTTKKKDNFNFMNKKFFKKNNHKIPRPKLLSDIEYKQYDNFPIFSKHGIKVIKLPPVLRLKLTNMWLTNRKDRQLEEINKHTEKYVVTRDGKSPTYLVNIDNSIQKELEKFVSDELTKWIGMKNLKHTASYGIREYTRDSFLSNHVDRYDTHILSAIINVGQIDMDEPWALTVQNRLLKPRDIIFDKGFDVALYESSTLVHGRPKPLKGKVYANFFIHYAPSNWNEKVKKLNII